MNLCYIHETFLPTISYKGFVDFSYVTLMIAYINIADLGTKLIEKLNEMVCFSAVVSIVWGSN